MNLPRRIHSAPSPAHPSEETLLLFLDGELPSRQAPAIRAHLHRCWDCRAKAEKFQKGIYAFVDYAEQRVLPQAGEPPNEWRGFAPLLDRAAAASLEHPGWLTRYRQRWMTVATAAILAIVFVLWPMSAPPALSAKEFLAHARSSRRIATFSKRRIRIHVNGRQAGGAAIRSAFTEAKLDWSDPLNPDRFAAWHASVKAPIDRLTKSDRSVTLATSANEGLIREASFTLDAGDWHPTDESLRFGSGMNVEISEVTDTNEPPVEIAAHREPAHVPATPIGAQEFLAAEMQARVALHALGADLGEQWEIERAADGSAIVTGIFSTKDEFESAEQALSRIPHLSARLQLAPEGAVEVPADSPNQVISPMAAEPLLRDQLRKTFPDGGARAAFINRVLAASDEQLVRVLALKRLKDRYPAAAESELDDATRQKLHALVDDHLVHLRKQSALFAMSLEAIVDLPAEPPRGEAASWQQQAEAAYRSIEAIDQLCTELLSGAPRTTRDAAQSLRLLQASYQALRSALDLR